MTRASFFILFFFSCLYIQAQSDSCEVQYQKDKTLYEKQLAQVKETDFSDLLKMIYKDEEYKIFIQPDKNIILNILLLGRQKSTSENKNRNGCRKFEKKGYYDLYEKVWTKDNFLYFAEQNKDKIIIPAVNSVIIYNTSELKERIKWDTNTGKEIDENGNIQYFYYNTGLKLKQSLTTDNKYEHFSILGIAVLPVAYKSKENCYMIQLQFNDIKSDFKYSTPKVYQYKNKSWEFLESY